MNLLVNYSNIQNTASRMIRSFFLVGAALIQVGCGGDCLEIGGCGDKSSSGNVGSAGAPALSLYEATGSGDNVFKLPATVSVIQISANYPGRSSNFIVRVAGELKVNVLIGTSWESTSYEGRVTVIPGGTVEITDSAGVVWTIREVRL